MIGITIPIFQNSSDRFSYETRFHSMSVRRFLQNVYPYNPEPSSQLGFDSNWSSCWRPSLLELEKMTWIDQRNAATRLSNAPLPTKIRLHNICITFDLLPKIFHNQLLTLYVLRSVTFSPEKNEFGTIADEFFAQITRCKQLQKIDILQSMLKPAIKHLVYRSCVSLSLKNLWNSFLDCHPVLQSSLFNITA